MWLSACASARAPGKSCSLPRSKKPSATTKPSLGSQRFPRWLCRRFGTGVLSSTVCASPARRRRSTFCISEVNHQALRGYRKGHSSDAGHASIDDVCGGTYRRIKSCRYISIRAIASRNNESTVLAERTDDDTPLLETRHCIRLSV